MITEIKQLIAELEAVSIELFGFGMGKNRTAFQRDNYDRKRNAGVAP